MRFRSLSAGMATVAVLLSCSVSCGSRELTRSRAKSLWEARCDPKRMDRVSMQTFDLALQNQWITYEPYPDGGVRTIGIMMTVGKIELTDRGRRYFSEAIPAYKPIVGSALTLRLSTPIQAQLLEFTGVQGMAAEYAWAWSFPEDLKPHFREAGRQTGRARFSLWDDGWRLDQCGSDAFSRRSDLASGAAPPDERSAGVLPSGTVRPPAFPREGLTASPLGPYTAQISFTVPGDHDRVSSHRLRVAQKGIEYLDPEGKETLVGFEDILAPITCENRDEMSVPSRAGNLVVKVPNGDHLDPGRRGGLRSICRDIAEAYEGWKRLKKQAPR